MNDLRWSLGFPSLFILGLEYYDYVNISYTNNKKRSRKRKTFRGSLECTKNLSKKTTPYGPLREICDCPKILWGEESGTRRGFEGKTSPKNRGHLTVESTVGTLLLKSTRDPGWRSCVRITEEVTTLISSKEYSVNLKVWKREGGLRVDWVENTHPKRVV